MAALPLLAARLGAKAYPFLTEAWFVQTKPETEPGKGPPPSRHPGRKECAVIVARDGVRTLGRMYEIKRPAMGHIKLMRKRGTDFRPAERFHILPGAGHA